MIGNINEHGLIIGETTYGGISQLQSQSKAKIDYGSLIWITLQRSRNCQEAIKTLDYLMQTYGYASEGESFSIADQTEAWVMEIIGKGEYELGSVWVAIKIPNGSVSSHANQARIQEFYRYPSENILKSHDVVDFARSLGIFPIDRPDNEFSFSDVYDPVTFSGARLCDARVWSFFSSIMGDVWSQQYLDYATGYNLTNRMPLYVQPNARLTVSDVFEVMRNHYENSALDMSGKSFSDVGAANANIPYRAHPLSFISGGESYVNERPIATQQTGWNFVAQSRSWMPRELAAIMWFGVDDSSTTVHIPIYGSCTEPPSSYAGKGPQDGVTPPMMVFDTTKAFYSFNLLANWVYTRWSLIYPDLLTEILTKESTYLMAVQETDAFALNLYHTEGPQSAIKLVTKFSCEIGDTLVREWNILFGTLFVRYRDGYKITPNSDAANCGCNSVQAGYDQDWYDRIVSDTGDHYKTIDTTSLTTISTVFAPVNKLKLLARR